MDEWQGRERRYGEAPVRLINEQGEVLHGLRYAMYPVDEPPLVEVPSIKKRLYLSVWRDMGWAVENIIEGA